jgi:mevalonate kinase
MSTFSSDFHTHTKGKLLLSGEYFVLDGALALAIPTRLGQSLLVQSNKQEKERTIQWESLDKNGQAWFSATFQLSSLSCLNTTDQETADRLKQVFSAIEKQKPTAWANCPALDIQTKLDFDRQWGLGTSSTLLAALAQWQQVEPYQLLWDTFGGSAYDIACATAKGPIVYILNDKKPLVESVSFKPNFVDDLYLVYTGQKQNSREGIQRYRSLIKDTDTSHLIDKVSLLSLEMLRTKDLATFEQVLAEHEALISETLQMPTIQQQYFQDFWGQTKSLGAWGGDFMLVASERGFSETQAYFHQKGLDQFFQFSDWLLL